MAINTAEKRRSVIDFGQIRGTGMPVPSGASTASIRAHILNLYAGLVPVTTPFFFWRNRNKEDVSTTFAFWRNRTKAVTVWRPKTGSIDP